MILGVDEPRGCAEYMLRVTRSENVHAVSQHELLCADSMPELT